MKCEVFKVDVSGKFMLRLSFDLWHKITSRRDDNVYKVP